MPYAAAFFISSYRSAHLRIALEGMHPQLTQTPPGRSRSTTATRIPSCAPRIAATYPPGPAPITTRSNCLIAPSGRARRFEPEDEVVQEPRGRPPVDQPVIERQAQVHHVPRDDLPLPHDR